MAHGSLQTARETDTHLLHVLRLRGRRVPAVVQDEDVGPGETLAHFVEELLLLNKGRTMVEEGPPVKAPSCPAQQARGQGGGRVTVCISVDSELATSTKTSASRQNLSIQLSSSVVTSIPGLVVTGVISMVRHRAWAQCE